MPRVDLSNDVLRRDDDPPPPPFAEDLASTPPHPEEPATIVTSAPSPPERSEKMRHKFTVMLNDDGYDQLDAVTAAVVAELAPRPVGKGWSATVVRALVALAADDDELRGRIVDHLRKV